MFRENDRVFSIVHCNFSTLACWLQDTKSWPMEMVLEAGEKFSYAKQAGTCSRGFLGPSIIPVDDRCFRVVAFLNFRDWVGFELSRKENAVQVAPYTHIPWQRVAFYLVLLLSLGGWPILLFPLFMISAKLWTERLSRLYLEAFCRYVESLNLHY